MTEAVALLSESDSEYEPEVASAQVAEAVKATKGQFVSRIYTIMLLQITVCIAVTILIRQSETLRYVFAGWWMLLTALILLCAIVGVLFCAKEFSKKKEVTYTVFGVFCLNQELLIGVAAAHLNPSAVLICESMCFTVTIALLIYTLYTANFRSSLGLPIAIFATVIAFAIFMRLTYDTNPLELVNSM